MKKRIVVTLLAVLLLTMCAAPALAAAPKIKKVEYEGNGVVEVDFTTKNVRYRNVKVVVKDVDGNRKTTKILEKDNDEISFKVSGMAADSTYIFTITGVRAGNSGAFGKVTGRFMTPANKPVITFVKYDPNFEALEVDFAAKMQYKNLKVTIRDNKGKYLFITDLEKDSDELNMDVEGMVVGKTYTITVSGVRVKGVGKYTKVSKKFVA